MPEAPKRFPYGVHASVTHMAAIASNLPKRTGKSLEDRIRLMEAGGPAGTRARSRSPRAWASRGSRTSSASPSRRTSTTR